MPRFEIAHLKERDSNGLEVHLIIVPLEQSFGYKTANEQEQAKEELQLRATAANLAGTVCPVWDAGAGRMGFIAPPQWHPYFKSLTLGLVMANVNRELSWS